MTEEKRIDLTKLGQEEKKNLTIEERRNLPSTHKPHKCKYCETPISSGAKACSACYTAHQKGRKLKQKARTITIPERKYNPMISAKENRKVPPQAKRLYGCLNCDWKGTGKCPYGFRTGAGTKLEDNMHQNMICNLRIQWLAMLSVKTRHVPTFAEWQARFNKILGQMKHMNEYKKYEEAERELERIYQEGGDEKELKEWEAKKKEARDVWWDMNKELTKGWDRELDRVSKEKIETDGRVRLVDIHNLMREKPVEAEFKEEEDEE